MMKFYFLIKFIVEMTYLSMKTWTTSISFLYVFSRSREQTFSVKNHIELLINSSTVHDLCFHRADFRVSISLLRCVMWSVNSYWETHLYTHLRIKTLQYFTCKSNGSILHDTLYICIWGRTFTQKIIVLSHFWSFKTRFSCPRQYFWLYISRNSCSVTHLTTRSHHEHSNHYHHMCLRIRTIFVSPTQFSCHIVLL